MQFVEGVIDNLARMLCNLLANVRDENRGLHALTEIHCKQEKWWAAYLVTLENMYLTNIVKLSNRSHIFSRALSNASSLTLGFEIAASAKSAEYIGTTSEARSY